METDRASENLIAALGNVQTIESEERYTFRDFELTLGLWGWSLKSYFEGLDAMLAGFVACRDAWASLRNVGAFFGLGICLRFIKSFRANKRMNAALTTLQRAGPDCRRGRGP